MMDMKEFTEKMKAEIMERLPDDVREGVIINDVEVVKMNDQKLHGLAFKMPDSDAAPTMYLEDMYRAYKDGVDTGELASQMADMFTGTKDMPKPPEVDLTYDAVKNNLTVRLLEKTRNIEFLSNMPHVNVGNGLAIIADINFGEERGGEWRVAVNNNVLESLGVDKEQLFMDAMENAKTYDPPVLTDMSNALFSPERINLLEKDEPIAPENVGNMYVLTNSAGHLGAAALFYPDVKEKMGELFGGDYYILPSSTHEVILVPDTGDVNKKHLCDTVKQANRTVVEDKDILSDNVYHYSRDERRLDRVTEDKERGDRVAEGR